jgi:hypothetical protein
MAYNNINNDVSFGPGRRTSMPGRRTSVPGRRSSKTGGRSPRDEGGCPPPTEEKRTSWAISDWEELERSMEELGVWDEDTNYDSDDVVQPNLIKCDTSSSDDKILTECDLQGLQSPRRGSLFELILKDDAPTISGCVYPKMRRLGLMQEKIIADDESQP